VPAFSPFRGPLTSGLRFTSTRTPTSIKNLSDPISTTGLGMNLLADTLLSMVSQWEDREVTFHKTLESQCQTPEFFRSFTFNQMPYDPICRGTALGNLVSAVNSITQTVLGNLGRAIPRLEQLTR